jgi:O-antigen/teichoic acid export membrane protein
MSASVGLGARARAGLQWTIINSVGEKALSFGTTMVLARLLDPEHFGLYALAFVVIDMFQIFKNLGLDAALVQRTDQVDEAADTVFLVLPLIGLALFGLLFVTAPWLAQALGNPEVARPLQALGFVLVLMSLGNVPAALIQRGMRFDLRTWSNLSGMIAYAVLAIVLARHGWGVWSLVVAYLTRWLVTMPLQWLLLGWRPRGRFHPALLREMLHFSKYVLGAWLVGLMMMNIDKIAIARWLGATQLGYYTLCLGLANIIMTQLSMHVYQVAFPAFAQAQHDVAMQRRGVVKLMKYLLLVGLPVMIVLLIAAEDVLRVAYGPRWVGAAPLLRVLALGGLLQTLRLGLEPILLGSGRAHTVFHLNLLQLGLLAIGAVAMAKAQQPLGVAWAVVVAAAIPLFLNARLVCRQLGLGWPEIFTPMRPILWSGASMACLMGACQWLRPWAGAWARQAPVWLGLLCVVGAAGYGVMVKDSVRQA